MLALIEKVKRKVDPIVDAAAWIIAGVGILAFTVLWVYVLLVEIFEIL
jgi:hypothetical protein